MKSTGSGMMPGIGFAVAAGFLVSFAGSARAETATPRGATPTSSWVVKLAPYAWATGIEGDVGLLGLPSQSVDLGFSDVLENLDGGFMGVAEARRGRLSIGLDMTYANLGQTIGTPQGLATNAIDATVKTAMLTAVVGYDLMPDDNISIDLVGGGRYWSVKNTFDFAGGLLDGTEASQSEDWVDPVVGIRFRSPLGGRFDVAGWALVGGMGAGSETMWDLMAGSSYRIGGRSHIFVGYRASGVDYSNNGFTYDVIQRGPVFGGVFEF